MNIAELKKLAEAATPGPWDLADRGYMFIISKPGDGYVTRDVCRMDGSTMAAFSQRANAIYIQAANPAAILKLLAINAELVEALEMIHGAAMDMRGEDFNLSGDQWKKVHAALAKAEGGEL